MEEGLSDTEDDAKMHHIGRNRKRRQNGSEEKQSSRGSSKNPEVNIKFQLCKRCHLSGLNTICIRSADKLSPVCCERMKSFVF